MKKISVIIPVYNTELYISECLDSILGQTLSEIEIICIDDASTDRSYQILQEYANKHKNIKLLYQEKKGPGIARNTGIQEAQGEFICMMDSDDYYPNENVLELLYSKAIETDAIVCGGNILDVYPDGKYKPSLGNFDTTGFLDSIEHPRLYGQTRFIYNRNFILENHLQYLPYIRFEDPPFVLETLLRAGRYYTVEDYVYTRRTGYRNPTTNRDIACGVLYGIKKCIELSIEYNLRDFYDTKLSDLLWVCFDYIHPFVFAGDSKVWGLISEIKLISSGWDNGQMEGFEDCKAYKKSLEAFKEDVLRCQKAPHVVIYGAGCVAKQLLDAGYVNHDSIVGVATTYESDKERFFNYQVHQIGYYTSMKNEILVIVAAGETNSKEMVKELHRRGFEKYVVMSMRRLHILSIILDNQ